MNTTRRSTTPTGLSSKTADASCRSRSLSATSRSATYRANHGNSKERGSGLIVTRGLQELLDTERKCRRLRGAAPTTAAGGKSKANSQRRRSGQVPNFIICYLCGRQFGTASIDIHRPQCYLKRMIMWERGDPAIRGPKPISPMDHEKMMKTRMLNVKTTSGLAAAGSYPGAGRMGGGGLGRQSSLSEAEFYNELQMGAFTDTALSPCPNCGRTFLPDRLQVHLRSCKPGKAAKPIRVGSYPATPPAAKPSRVATSAAPAVALNRPIRAPGSYTVSTAAGADDVPPDAASARKRANSAVSDHTFLGVVDSKGNVPPTVTSALWNSGGARGESNVRVVGANTPGSAAAAAKAQDSNVIEVEVDMDDTDLHSTGTDELAEGDDSNDISHSPISASKCPDHAADSQPRETRTPSAPRTTDIPEMADTIQSEGLLGIQVQYTSAATYISATRGATYSSAAGERDRAKRIQLNNVSHFKKVPSRLSLQRRSADAKLIACTYCSRRFLPERVQRHESCCIDRNKPFGARKSETLPAAQSTNTVATKNAKSPLAAPVVEIFTTDKTRFCGGCGIKASAPDQKFCSECGYKL